MAEVNYLDAQRKSQKKLDYIINELYNLAQAFSITGNAKMYDELVYLGKEVEKAQFLSGEGFGILFNEHMASARQATINMFNAALTAVGAFSTNAESTENTEKLDEG